MPEASSPGMNPGPTSDGTLGTYRRIKTGFASITKCDRGIVAIVESSEHSVKEVAHEGWRYGFR